MAKIAFIQEELRERFGIMILSAVLKNEKHKCDVFIEERSNNIIEEVLSYKPDIIALSTMTPGIDYALNFIKMIKKAGSVKFVLMGGAHPTFYPEILNQKGIDGICVGEGEFALLELADALDKGSDFTSIKNLWVKKDGKTYKNDLRPLVDVNSLPMYDRNLYYEKYPEMKNVPTKKIFIVRGCPFNCTYCFNHALKKLYKGKGDYVRFLDHDKIITEMKYIKNNYGVTWFQFNGDTINVYRDWFMEFLDKYKKEINMPFMCNVRIDKVDEEMVKKMKSAKCDRVDFGIEHGDEKIRKTILKRNMSDQEIIKNGKLFIKYGIRVQTANIIGVPGETIESAMKTIRLNREIRPEQSRCFVLQPYPRTEIYDYAMKHGFLDKQYSFTKLGTGFQIGFDGSADDMTLKLRQKKELTNLYYFFNVLVKYRRFEPLILKLIKLPPNKLFLFVHAYPIVRIDVKYHRSVRRKFRSILGLFRILVK